MVKERDVETINRNYRISGYYLYKPSSIPGLGYELIPYAQGEREVNSHGMICKQYAINKETNVYRILVLGDSITQEYSFVENLEAMLNDVSPNLVFELWNAGVAGYQVSQYAAYLKHKGVRYKPDMLIVNFGLNDFCLNTVIYYETKDGIVGYSNSAYHLSKTIPLNKWCYRHSYLYRFLIVSLEKLLFSPPGENGHYVIEQKQEGKYYIELIKDICRKHKICLLGVIFPYLKRSSEYTYRKKNQYRMILDSLKTLDISVVDLHEYIPEEVRYSFRSDKEDYIHATPEGYKLAAMAVFRYLTKNYSKQLSLEMQ